MIVAVDGYRTVPFVAAAGSCSADSDSVVGDENHYAAAAVCAEDNSDSGTSICRQRQDYHNVRLDVVAVVVVVVVAAAAAAAGAALLLVAAFADVAVVAVVVAAFPVVVAAPAAVAV